MSDRGSYYNLEDRVRDLERKAERQDALIEVLLLDRTPPKRRSRSRSPSPPPAPRKEMRQDRAPPPPVRRDRSDYNIHIRGWNKELKGEEVVNYIESMYDIMGVTCEPDSSGFTACLKCPTKEDQRILLEEKTPEIMGRFGFKGLSKRFMRA